MKTKKILKIQNKIKKIKRINNENLLYFNKLFLKQ